MSDVTSQAGQLLRRLQGRLKMRHLQLLLNIRQHGSLTRVAEQLSTTQPAVTNMLNELEGMFGSRLFQRSARGMAPTPMGEVVLAYAAVMLNDLDRLASDMEAFSSGYAMRLHVGVTPFVSGRLLTRVLGRSQLPEYRLAIQVHEGVTDELVERLRDHRLDIVIGRAGSLLDVRGLNFAPLYSQQPRLIANRRLAAALSRGPLNWAALAELDWVLGAPNTMLREQVANLFLNEGVAPPLPITESLSTKLIGEIIASGERAVSIVPADIAEELVRVAGVAIVPFSFDWHLRPITIFTRSDDQGRKQLQQFIGLLREASGEMQGAPGH